MLTCKPGLDNGPLLGELLPPDQSLAHISLHNIKEPSVTSNRLFRVCLHEVDRIKQKAGNEGVRNEIFTKLANEFDVIKMKGTVEYVYV